MTVRTIEKMEKDVAALISQNIQSVPGVSAALAGVVKALQRAKKEAQNAAQTASAMGPSIQFSPAQQAGGPDNSSGPEMT
jgi:flagellar motor component MotA